MWIKRAGRGCRFSRWRDNCTCAIVADGVAYELKNGGFAADLAAGIELSEETAPRRSNIAGDVLTGRANRIAELASGAVVSRTHKLVDPARCPDVGRAQS